MTGPVASMALPAAPADRSATPLAERIGAEAFARVHAEVAQRLWGYVRSHVGSAEEADDVVQETFTRVLASSLEPESDEHLIRYLYRSASNLLRDGRRGRLRWTMVPVDETTSSAPPTSTDRLDVERALGELRPKDRQLLWLAHVEGYDHATIAEQIDASPGSVRVLLFRARKRLAALLGGDRSNAKETNP